MMPAIKTYNGWTNYETWCVNLWLTDEASTEQEVRMLAQMHDVSVGYRADRIHDLVMELDDNNGLLTGASLFTDLLISALYNVNWHEIVENHQYDDGEPNA